MERRDDIEEPGEVELVRRVAYSLLLPAGRLAARHAIPLSELTTLAQLVYFGQLRQRSWTLKEIGQAMDVSLRTVKRLAQKMRQNFFAPEVEHELPRRIEFMLGTSPMSRARIQQVLGDVEEDAVDAALEALLREERVKLEDDGSATATYRATRPVTRLATRESWVARIGALNALMSNVSQTVQGRFFTGDPASFARTISFRLRTEDLGELREFYEAQLMEKLKELEARTESADGQEEEEDEAIEIQLSLIWAPYER